MTGNLLGFAGKINLLHKHLLFWQGTGVYGKAAVRKFRRCSGPKRKDDR